MTHTLTKYEAIIATATVSASGAKSFLARPAKRSTGKSTAIVVSVDANGGFFVDKKEVIGADGLLALLNENSENNKDRRIHVRGDKSVAYGRIVEAMGIINAAGYAMVALVSETPATKTR